MRTGSACALVVAFLLSSPLQAGPHLGMKLACKRYGDAWNSGSRSGVMAASTSDFARVWSRVPADMFSRMPRGGDGSVVATRKGPGRGEVVVSTPRGRMTFVVVGSGFQWRVADVYKSDGQGAVVSVKNTLDAGLTAREFYAGFRAGSANQYESRGSRDFVASIHQLTSEQRDRARRFLPATATTAITPRVTFQGGRAVVQAALPKERGGGSVSFHLKSEGGWKVDDIVFDSELIAIPSFRRSLALVANVSAFGDFARGDRSLDPLAFTTNGPLQKELLYIKASHSEPLSKSADRKKFEVSDDFRSVYIRYDDKEVRATGDARGVLTHVECRRGADWQDLANLLTMRRRVQLLSQNRSSMTGLLPDRLAKSIGNRSSELAGSFSESQGGSP